MKTNGSIIRQVAFTVPVTTSDTVNLPNGATRALMVNGTGLVTLVYSNGLEDTLYLTQGVMYPLSVVRVKTSGTTATGIKAGY